MSTKKTIGKLALSIAFDVSDFFVGRIPILGTFYDILGGLLGIWLWGYPGGLQFLEVIDITDQFDSFIPTVTLVGIFQIIRGNHK